MPGDRHDRTRYMAVYPLLHTDRTLDNAGFQLHKSAINSILEDCKRLYSMLDCRLLDEHLDP